MATLKTGMFAYIANGKRDLKDYQQCIGMCRHRPGLPVFGIPFVHGKEEALSFSGYTYCNISVHPEKSAVGWRYGKPDQVIRMVFYPENGARVPPTDALAQL
jgi:hypothetical protein